MTENRKKYLQILEEVKMKSNNKNRQTDWINKVLANRDKHFDIVVKFAEEAKKRLGIKDE